MLRLLQVNWTHTGQLEKTLLDRGWDSSHGQVEFSLIAWYGFSWSQLQSSRLFSMCLVRVWLTWSSINISLSFTQVYEFIQLLNIYLTNIFIFYMYIYVYVYVYVYIYIYIYNDNVVYQHISRVLNITSIISKWGC